MDEFNAVERIQSVFDVSRETLAELDVYVGLLRRWSKAINLVSRGDLAKIWSRHIGDSLGLIDFVRREVCWMDVGSGGGFPAIPLALLARQRGLGAKLCMVEADHRKAAFLRTACRELKLEVELISDRVEHLGAQLKEMDIITTRAFASVDKTLEAVEGAVGKQCSLVLLKGRGVESELTDAHKRWHISFELRDHPLSVDGVILHIRGFERALCS